MGRIGILLALLAGGCGRAEPDAHAHPNGEARPVQKEARRVPRAPAAGPSDELVEIPAGTVLAGSRPGLAGRRAAVEMDEVPAALDAFSMERDLRPGKGLSREQAERTCAGDGRRLCTELEWEWACEGKGHRDRALDPSPFQVRSMGRSREWTASAWGARDDEQALGAALRGARPGAPEDARRCAARTPEIPPPPAEREDMAVRRGRAEADSLRPERGTRAGLGELEGREPLEGNNTSLADVALRCCAGAANDARYVMEPPRGTFMPLRLPSDRFASIVRSIPELAPVHGSPIPFTPRDVEIALAKPGAGAAPPTGWRFGVDPLIWTPERGEQLLILLGRSGPHSFVAALHRLHGDRFAHAASMVLRDDVTPLLLAWGALRRELVWTPCWNCPETEGGKIVYRIETADVRITHF